jgi:hypothetical protein
MDPMTAMMVAGGVGKLVGNISQGIQKNRLLKLEAQRLQANKRMLEEQRQSQGQLGSMRLGEMLGQAMMSRLGGGLAMSGSVLESETQNQGFRDFTMRQGLYQTDLQMYELNNRITDNSASRGGLFMSTLLDSLGGAAESAGNIYSQQAKVPTSTPNNSKSVLYSPIPSSSQRASSNWSSKLFP